MLELAHNALTFSFPEVHEDAKLTISFQRTLRIPDDGTDYPLPPGLGRFPLRHVDDFSDRLPATWRKHGGVMLPMHQAEAMWLSFDSGAFSDYSSYPMAVKVAAGKINAVSGEEWREHLHRDPQDYLVAPKQPWLDGYNVGEDRIRQFVAMPLGDGYTAEEQITGKADWGGVQIIVYPIKPEVYERIREKRSLLRGLVMHDLATLDAGEPLEMGLAPGGSMRQKIYEDSYGFDDWDLGVSIRCFVHIANSETWKVITGEPVPTEPPTPEAYNNAGLPWFDLYDADRKSVPGSETLGGLASVAERKAQEGAALEDNESVDPSLVKVIKWNEGDK